MKKACFRSNNSWSLGIKTTLLLTTIITSLLSLPPSGLSATFVKGLSYPTGIAIHPNERSLYVNSGSSGTVWKIPIKDDGTAGAISVVTDQFDPPAGIVFDAAGNLYGVANVDGYGYVYMVSTTGSVCSMRFSYNDGFSGIAVETPGLSNNKLYVGEADDYGGFSYALLSSINCDYYLGLDEIGYSCGPFRYLLYRTSRADIVGSYGNKVVTVNLANASCTSLVTNLIQPNGLAEDSKGNLYIADTGAGKIIKRDILGKTSEIAKGLSGPNGLFFDSETGFLFISETNAGRITTIPVDSSLSGKIILKVKDASNQWSPAIVAPKMISPNSPAACVDDSNILYVFATKEDDQVYMSKRTPAGVWSAWTKVPGTLKTNSSPTTAFKQGKVFIYVRGFDDKIWENIYTISTKAWGSWKSISGVTTPESPDVTSDNSGKVYLLTRGWK